MSTESPDARALFKSFMFFLRLNVKTFFMLLQLLQPELEAFDQHEIDKPVAGESRKSGRITVIARRLLPSLRHYSSWLKLNLGLLIGVDEFANDSLLSVQVKEMWRMYASTLSLLASTFSSKDLDSVEYLLEEDEDTLGFSPFKNELTESRYLQPDSETYKPKLQDHGVDRCHPNVENMARICDFLTDGLELAVNEVGLALSFLITTIANSTDERPDRSSRGHYDFHFS